MRLFSRRRDRALIDAGLAEDASRRAYERIRDRISLLERASQDGEQWRQFCQSRDMDKFLAPALLNPGAWHKRLRVNQDLRIHRETLRAGLEAERRLLEACLQVSCPHQAEQLAQEWTRRLEEPSPLGDWMHAWTSAHPSNLLRRLTDAGDAQIAQCAGLAASEVEPASDPRGTEAPTPEIVTAHGQRYLRCDLARQACAAEVAALCERLHSPDVVGMVTRMLAGHTRDNTNSRALAEEILRVAAQRSRPGDQRP